MTVDYALVTKAKMAKRITTDVFDVQIEDLLCAAIEDLKVAGVEIPETSSPLIEQAAITYFLMRFGEPDEYDRLKASYDEQKAQLVTATGYTNWGGGVPYAPPTDVFVVIIAPDLTVLSDPAQLVAARDKTFVVELGSTRAVAQSTTYSGDTLTVTFSINTTLFSLVSNGQAATFSPMEAYTNG